MIIKPVNTEASMIEQEVSIIVQWVLATERLEDPTIHYVYRWSYGVKLHTEMISKIVTIVNDPNTIGVFYCWPHQIVPPWTLIRKWQFSCMENHMQQNGVIPLIHALLLPTFEQTSAPPFEDYHSTFIWTTETL